MGSTSHLAPRPDVKRRNRAFLTQQEQAFGENRRRVDNYLMAKQLKDELARKVG